MRTKYLVWSGLHGSKRGTMDEQRNRSNKLRMAVAVIAGCAALVVGLAGSAATGTSEPTTFAAPKDPSWDSASPGRPSDPSWD